MAGFNCNAVIVNQTNLQFTHLATCVSELVEKTFECVTRPILLMGHYNPC